MCFSLSDLLSWGLSCHYPLDNKNIHCPRMLCPSRGDLGNQCSNKSIPLFPEEFPLTASFPAFCCVPFESHPRNPPRGAAAFPGAAEPHVGEAGSRYLWLSGQSSASHVCESLLDVLPALGTRRLSSLKAKIPPSSDENPHGHEGSGTLMRIRRAWSSHCYFRFFLPALPGSFFPNFFPAGALISGGSPELSKLSG